MNENAHNISVPGATEPIPYQLGSRTSLVTPNPKIVAAPVAAKQPKESDDVAADDFSDMPTDYASLLRLSEQHLSNYTGPYDSYQSEIRRRMAAVQQGLPVLEMDHQKNAIERGTYINNANKLRASRIVKLEAQIESGDPLPIIPGKVANGVIMEYLQTVEFTNLASIIRPALWTYEIAFLKSHTWLNPRTRAKECAAALASNPTDEVVSEIINEEALIKSAHFKIIASSRAARLQQMYDETVKPGVLLLLNSALIFFMENKLAAIVKEVEFLESNGAKIDDWKPTAASKRYDEIIAKIDHCYNHIKNPTPVAATSITAPSPDTALKFIFGVDNHPEGD